MSTDRRQFMTRAIAAASAVTLSGVIPAAAHSNSMPPCPVSAGAAAGAPAPKFPDVFNRPSGDQRAFTSPAVEARIQQVKSQIANPDLARLFENCYPNTLDTTVSHLAENGQDDTFIITGDIPAMWLRDSSAQVSPYVRLAKDDAQLRSLFRGLLRRQSRCILQDPYANAFYADPTCRGEWKNDDTDMQPGVHERKWELDSLCYPIRIAYAYWKASGDVTAFDDQWHSAAKLIVSTMRVQQRFDFPGPYKFGRKSSFFYDNSPNYGLGSPTRKVGLIHSAFRPSDDCCFYPFLIPSNMFAELSLRQLAEIATAVLHDDQLANDCTQLSAQLKRALQQYSTCKHPTLGTIYAFEADGFGNVLMMDDANIPSLLSLPYLGCCAPNDTTYLRTRSFVLSDNNPFFHRGKEAEGIGGPHVAPNKIWPLSIIMRALTSRDDAEILTVIRTLVKVHAASGLMHESFDPDKPQDFSRPWFAWCNSLFGELIDNLAERRPDLLKAL